MQEKSRFQFISHALNGDGPFRPVLSFDTYGKVTGSTQCYLVQYPRESDEKYARRAQVAFYSSPLSRVCSKFAAYLAMKPVSRDIKNDMLKMVEDDADGKGNGIDVFWQGFIVDAKARGSMLLLVDMPAMLPESMSTQLEQRVAPTWMPIYPEKVTDYQIGDDGKFDYVMFLGSYINAEGEEKSCQWYFDRMLWRCLDEDDAVVDEAEHPIGECPVLIFTETGDYPCFGPFSPIADLSKRLYNLDSELDEILRSQTFSLLTMQVPEDSSDKEKLEAAKVAGETIGTNNLMVHTGQQPGFIAPSEGPASVYMERIRDLRHQINEIGLEVAVPNQQESGIAMQLRFQTVNAELARFAERIEGLERRAWEVSGKWLGIEEVPDIEWPRDFNLADPQQELDILQQMQQSAMPPEVIVEQMERVAVTQFTAMDPERMDRLIAALDMNRSQ